jgi:hypothetical protein
MRHGYVIHAALVSVLLPVCSPAQDAWPKRWPTATPETVGLDARELASFDADLAAGKYGHMDGMLIIRHGKVVYERAYKHDYERIYGIDARKSGPLNAHDFSGPYNYFNTWWHPYYRRGDLHTLQ